MGTLQPSGLNWDADNKFTMGEYGNRGDGTDKWYIWIRAANAGIIPLGAVADAMAATGDGTVISLLKALRGVAKREDDGHTNNDYGYPSWQVRNDGLTNLIGAVSDYGPLSVGQGGEAFVTDVPPQNATTAAAVALSEAESTALEASRVIKASAGTLFRFGFFNNNAAARFILLHNTTSLPADGQVPKIWWPVAAGQRLDFNFGRFGIRFTTGITACISTTGPTKTIGGSDAWFNAGYK